ncbi:hypothetical protein BSR29_00785 [Boudabousia liubingyangii]|uniref:asparagine synthase (glutamine-hydrolyzing) n=1 Tax=Boudabousia liubingyangii TaxID=1921764 RepID=A0A1Q5PQ42_9ACTO|nr:asparagine synthase-related protein [Boudabousia liubingyangii]OKL49525.1 hypothetical protein BSR29_00785 [Boudabousia liubingyangii]
MNLKYRFTLLKPQDQDPNLHYHHGLGLDLPKNFSWLDDTAVLALRSHYAGAQISNDQVVLVTDQMRSFPLYYLVDEESVAVSDNWQYLAELNNYEVDPAGFQQIAAAGFCFSDRTAYRNIRQVLPGTRIRIDLATGKVQKESLHVPLFESEKYLEQDDFLNALSQGFDTAMKRAVSLVGDSKILVPLSGGLDSRLIVCWLSENKIPNVHCFTYGRPDSAEVRISEAIAKNLGLAWTGVDLLEDKVKEAWNQSETADFLRYAFAGYSLPHVQDWYALKVLTEAGIANPGDVVFPGHTIVDNFHNHELLEEVPVNRKKLCSVLLHKHLLFNSRIDTSLGTKEAAKSTLDFLNFTDYNGSARSLQKTVEGYNFFERQCKYINNSMRAYEFFKLRWAIPMLDRDFTDIWCQGAIDLTITRRAYGEWISSWYNRLANTETQYHTGIAGKLPTPIVDFVRKVDEFTGVGKLINRVLAVPAALKHPLGFDMYRNHTSNNRLILNTLKGAPVHSHWADEFLSDSWHSELSLFQNQS